MFYSWQIYTFLVESISNCLREENRLDSNKTEAITHREVFYKTALLSWMSETLKNTYEEVPFLAKLRLEAYNFIKNELLRRHFSNNFI